MCVCVCVCVCVSSFLIRALFSFPNSVPTYIPIFGGFSVYLKENESVRRQGENLNLKTVLSFVIVNEVSNIGNSEQNMEIKTKIKGVILCSVMQYKNNIVLKYSTSINRL